MVHTGDGSWEDEAQRIAALREAGVECELLDANAVRAAEPELRGELIGASWFPHDLQCAPRAIARGLARAAEALGATVETGRAASSVSVDGGRVTGVAGLAADTVVIAGRLSAPLARSAGLELPVEPRKGQLVRLERRPDFLRHKVIDGSYMAAVESEDAGLAVSTVIETTIDGHVLVGSSRERRGFDLVDGAVTDALLVSAARVAPGIASWRSTAPGRAYDPGSPAAFPRSAPRPSPRASGSRPATRARASRTGPSREGSSPRRSAARRRRSTWRRSALTASAFHQRLERRDTDRRKARSARAALWIPPLEPGSNTPGAGDARKT